METERQKKKKVHELPRAPALVGTIVEKFVSSPSPSSFPQPSVLPFPVARHRSHGPHWTPANAEPSTDEGTAEEDADASLYGPISSFAGPIERKEKKGLDFSRWKDLVPGNDDVPIAPVPRRKVPKPAARRIEEEEVEKETVVAPWRSVKPLETVVAREERTATNGTMMDDIDAENLARLGQMSAEEIAEAQEEIAGRMDPAVLEMLKKRGRDKLGKKKDDAPEKKSKIVASTEDLLQDVEPRNRSWETWRERVEKVRDLRFSLDGGVLEGSPASEKHNGNVENVAERDFLRTEGDPGAIGYTIKEAVELTRSMIPGQRALALQLLTAVLNKALYNLQGKDSGFSMIRTNPIDKLIDWQAVWAFALGPGPQIALSLRIALDDNHDSVVMSCAKAIQSILSCDINENFFNIREQMPMVATDLYTAPIFRSKPEIDGGFLQGGFWKYNTKPSNLLPLNNESVDEEVEGNHTIQDDVVVAGQDVAAGLIRMGILPRICYLLEMDPHTTLEECLLSVLTALARHSPTSANAIMRCPRLIHTVVKMLTRQGKMEGSVQTKAIVLLKVLCQSDRQICSDLMKQGVSQQAMWQWYKPVYTIEQWVESGREHCKLTSSLMVEQLRLWKVCIRYGYCVTYFADFFSVVCLWLSFPNFVKLMEKNVLGEFVSVTREAYLVLEALAQRLPPLHSADQLNKQDIGFSDDNMEAWSWSHVIPMVELAIKWLELKNIPYLSSIIGYHKGSMVVHDQSASCMMWVLSAVLHMLCGIFDRITTKGTDGCHNNLTKLPWLPQFVPKVGLEIVKNGFLNFKGLTDSTEEFHTDGGSLLEYLCYLRQQNDFDSSVSSICCLHGLLQLVFSVDSSVQKARNTCCVQTRRDDQSGIADRILKEGITRWARNDLANVLTVFTTLVSSEWSMVQSVEMFGRGGPAPGIGFGWGSSGGGFWSLDIFLRQVDAHLVVKLFEFFPVVLEDDPVLVEPAEPKLDKSVSAVNITLQKVNSLLAVCLIAGPRDRAILEKAFDLLLQAPSLKYLGSCVQCFLRRSQGFKPFQWKYGEEDYLSFSKVLYSHFRNRWLSAKRKSSAKVDFDNHSHDASRKNKALETIHEDQESSEMVVKHSDCSSLLKEWAHQRLPLPVHWILSAICSVGDKKSISTCSTGAQDVAKAGLLLLLCLEATSLFPCSAAHNSVISRVPLVWKFHALSVALHANMDVLEDEKSRDVFESLQELYGQHLDASRHRKIEAQSDRNEGHVVISTILPETPESDSLELLNFERQIHESYTTFVENLIEQFGSISYGDTIFGRQVALYLHQSIEAPVRLAAWNALSNARVLELLPELENCIAEPNGYLEPAEVNNGILEAYVKSWTSGALDRAATQSSMSFTLVLHHLSRFIFNNVSDMGSLHKKLAKSLLRSYLHKQHQEAMFFKLIQYELPVSEELVYRKECRRRLELLGDACDGNSSLLAAVDKLKSSLQ